MATDNSAPENTQQETAKANWSALSQFSDNVVVEDFSEVKTDEDKQVEDTVKEGEEVKTEGDVPAAQAKTDEPTEDLKKEALELGLEENATKEQIESAKAEKATPVIEFKPEDVEGAPADFEDGTYRALAKEMGADLTEESFDAFKEKFVLKSELEKVTSQTKDNLLSSISSPEVVVALKLKELGVPDELVLEPTRNIDSALSNIEKLLELDNAQLYRKELEMNGYTEEMINTKMDSLNTDGKLDALADIVRFDLNKNKEALTTNKQNILASRDTIIKEFNEKKQAAETQKVEQERSQVKDALSKATDFFGTPLSQEVKDALVRKFESGAYDNDFKTNEYKANYILHKEFGKKVQSHLENKFFAKGVESIVKKQANIPDQGSKAVKRVDNTNQLAEDNWGAAKGFS